MGIPLPDSHQQELDFAQIISDQAIFGWEFSYEEAQRLYHELDGRMQEIEREVRPHLLMEIDNPWKPLLKPWNNDNSLCKRARDFWGEDAEVVGGPYTPFRWVEPDIGSRQKLMKQLMRYGWKPVNYTDKGNPQLDEESLEGLDLGEVGNLLMEYFKAKQRRSTLLGEKGTGWLTQAWEYEPGRYRIAAKANSLGTNTHRVTHSGVANVPKAQDDVYYGHQFRSLFIAPPGWEVLGKDAEQLEFRIALSYMGATKMIELVHSGADIHTMIWEDLEDFMNSRSSTKNVVYASIYDATEEKLGSMADKIPPGMTKRDAGVVMLAKLKKYMPGLDAAGKEIKSRASRGWIRGLDGFPVYLRKNKKTGRLQLWKAVNTVYQHAGSMVMKRANVMFINEIKERGLQEHHHQVGYFHDETQDIIREGMGPVFGPMFNDCLVKSGRSYGLACDMAAEWKVGPNWAHTH